MAPLLRTLRRSALTVACLYLAGSAVDARGVDGPGRAASGQYLAIAGNCFSCHTKSGGQPFAGGVAFYTAFGTIYSSNITPDATTGIGAWSLEEFTRAMREGVGRDGEHLYPAFPYTAFTLLSDEDLLDLFAYLKTLRSVEAEAPPNELKFPVNLRMTLAGWKSLYFRARRFSPSPALSAEENRGAYLVQALGHCSACHTPRNLLGGEDDTQFLGGGALYEHVRSGDIREWSSSNLTPHRTGLGNWSNQDIVDYLKTGFSARATSFGPMNQVIANSTRHLTDPDLESIAAHLKSLPAVPSGRWNAIDAGRLEAGEYLYDAHCGSCHLPTGLGDKKTAPPLRGSAVVQAASPATLINVILHGPQLSSALVGGVSRPDMPSFDSRLDDGEVALVATYIRNAWGNQAGAVSADQVSRQR